MKETILRKTRKAKGMEMAQVARDAGIAYTVLGMYETGTNIPSKQTAEKLAAVLGTTTEELFPGEKLKEIDRWHYDRR